MLVLLFVEPSEARFTTASSLREALLALGPTVWLDAVSVVSACEGGGTDEAVNTIARVTGAALDALEPATWRHSIVTAPSWLEGRAPDLAFWLKRKAFSPCVVLNGPSSPAADWAKVQADSIRGGSARVVRIQGPPAPKIETDRLLLTVPSENQARGYFDAIIGTAMFDTLVWEGPKTAADLAEFAMASARDHARASESWLTYGIINRASDEWIGTVGARQGDRDRGRFTLGYNLAVRAHGKGYATEAVGALVQYLFREKLAARIDADVFVGNDPSARVLEKLGFSREAEIRALYPKRGQRKDAWVYALLRSDASFDQV